MIINRLHNTLWRYIPLSNENIMYVKYMPYFFKAIPDYEMKDDDNLHWKTYQVISNNFTLFEFNTGIIYSL